MAQTGIQTFNDEIICYKHVKKDLSSHFDKTFKYEVGKYSSVNDADLTDKSCAAGLHVSNSTYWEYNNCKAMLMCKVKLEDIITVQEGKIRCKRLFVLAVTNNNVY